MVQNHAYVLLQPNKNCFNFYTQIEIPMCLILHKTPFAQFQKLLVASIFFCILIKTPLHVCSRKLHL